MRTTSYLLATLLTVVPGPIFARDCTHLEVVYHIPCTKEFVCMGGNNNLDALTNYSLIKNAQQWEKWIKEKGGPGCGGKCTAPIPWTPRFGIGSAWGVVCQAARARRDPWHHGMPEAIIGFARSVGTPCNVFCDPPPGSRTGCDFVYGFC
ncbi:hypothetical protein FKW77_005994 [Venturia effusa]|uniref:Killer toxin Kp4 domain-containing protein n=1 Tax=Venturia effusa TaxID=50376 RepID=A0A517L3F3_9PEZI|nr:hypothetical protein FKW77_005994 [Venturia effusa]